MRATLLVVLVAWPVTALLLGLVLGRALHACAGHDGVLHPGPTGLGPEFERRPQVVVPPISRETAV
jgi:hypothetical protein